MSVDTPEVHQQTWLDKLSDFLLREPKDKEQLMKLLRYSEQRNLFNKDALKMLESVLSFSELTVKPIMIPRNKMVSIKTNDNFEDIVNIVINSKHSRIPCFQEDGEEINGILHAKDILPYLVNRKESLNIKNILRKTIFVPENKKVDILLKEFKNSRNHMAIVLDEYGSVIGLATIEDVIEQIVGDIIDEFESD